MHPTKLAMSIAKAKLSRASNKITGYPFNLTLSVTGKCNSKCRTCNIWKNGAIDLSLEQWKMVLRSIRKNSYWITISGGEPFLRSDFVDLMRMVNDSNPRIITIATNGILTEKIVKDVRQIKGYFSGNLIINISVDGAGDKHDSMRGVECHEQVEKTIFELKKVDGVHVGVHTVISKFNIDKTGQIIQYVKKLEPHSYISQIVENRVELGNMDDQLLPDFGEYLKANKKIRNVRLKSNGVSRLTKLMRNKYYDISNKTLQGQKSVDCYAGIASAHVNYNGDLWACCVKAEKMGNLLDQDFDEIWKGKKAQAIRKRIKDDKCSCTMANACYSNILCEPQCVFF